MRAISSRSPDRCTRSSSAGTRTSSARPTRRRPVASARTGSGSSQARRGGRASSTTCPSRSRRCFRPARCSGARATSGFEYPDLAGALADLESELAELKAELTGEPAPETEADPRHFEELGDLLFAVVNVGRRLNVDPELALRSATGRFRTRVERAEQLAAEEGSAWAELPLEEQDRYYDRAKEVLR